MGGDTQTAPGLGTGSGQVSQVWAKSVEGGRSYPEGLVR
jgi:hypothetical protein